METSRKEEQYFNEFYKGMKDFAFKIKNRDSLNSNEKEEIDEFVVYKDLSIFICDLKGTEGGEYLSWIGDVYISRKLDKNQPNWTILETFRHTVLFEFEELLLSTNNRITELIDRLNGLKINN